MIPRLHSITQLKEKVSECFQLLIRVHVPVLKRDRIGWLSASGNRHEPVLLAIIETDGTVVRERDCMSRMNPKIFRREANTCLAVMKATLKSLLLWVDERGMIAYHKFLFAPNG